MRLSAKMARYPNTNAAATPHRYIGTSAQSIPAEMALTSDSKFAPQLFDVEHGKPLAAQPAQLRMIRQNDRPERPEMQQNVKQHLVFQIPDAQEVLQNGEMAGAGDRQKLRKPLYDTK